MQKTTLYLLGIAALLLVVVGVALVATYGSSPSGLSAAGYLGGASISSISDTTLNGRAAHLISLGAYSGGADSLFAEAKDAKLKYNITFTEGKRGNRYIYRATERIGASRAIQYYEEKSHYVWDGWSLPKSFDQFKAECGAANLAFNVGETLKPEFYCFGPRTKWIISDFDRLAGINDPQVYLQTDLWDSASLGGFGINRGQSEVSLTRTTTEAIIIDSQNGEIGKVSMGTMMPTFLTAPSSSGVKMITDADVFGPGLSIYPVDASIDSEVRDTKSGFSNCLLQAQRQTGQTYQFTFFDQVISTTGSYLKANVLQCVSDLKTQVQSMNVVKPTGDFSESMGADYSGLVRNATFSLENKYAIPQLNIWLYKDKVGVVGVSQANAIPSAVSCQNANLPGVSTSQITCSITNGPTEGAVKWSVSCPSPITVATASGSINMLPFATKEFKVDVSTGTYATTASCSIIAKSTDLKTSISNSFSITETEKCAITPRPGFYLRTNPATQQCEEYCPLTQEQCGTGKLNLNTCQCEGAPPHCTPQSCPSGQVWNSVSCSCSGGGDGGGTCTPLIQKKTTSYIGGIFGFGAVPVSTCVYDFMMIGMLIAALGLVIAIVGALMSRRGRGLHPVLIVGAGLLLSGLGLVAFSAVADNFLIVALGGLGVLALGVVVFLIVLAVLVLYALVKFGKYV